MENPFLTPSVTMGAGSTPGSVFARSFSPDGGVQFDADVPDQSAQMFALTRTPSGSWKIGPGWIYCGLTKVDIEDETTIPASAEKAYLHVFIDSGAFSAMISDKEDETSGSGTRAVSVVLYEFDVEGEMSTLKLDGRNTMFIPLYN